MKLSRLAHVASIVLAISGAIALIGAWLAGKNGTFVGFNEAHLYNDAIVLELIAIGAAVCTLVRLQLEAASSGRSPIV